MFSNVALSRRSSLRESLLSVNFSEYLVFGSPRLKRRPVGRRFQEREREREISLARYLERELNTAKHSR